jgi:excisionase family DNA binding protein
MNNVNIQVNGIDLNNLLERVEKLENSTTNPAISVEITEILLSRNEVAEILKISLPTLHDWTKKGLIKSYRIGNRIRFKKEDVFNALQERTK